MKNKRPFAPCPTSAYALASVSGADIRIEHMTKSSPLRSVAARHTSHMYDENCRVRCTLHQSSVCPIPIAPESASLNGLVPAVLALPLKTRDMPTFAVMRMFEFTALAASQMAL